MRAGSAGSRTERPAQKKVDPDAGGWKTSPGWGVVCKFGSDGFSISRRGYMAQSILVTGGAGFIGSHACKMLARAGYLPVTYDNLSTGHREAVQWGPLVEADLADR